MTIAEQLRQIKEKIATEQTWTQAAFARDENGDQVSPWDESACCWCVSGAAHSFSAKDCYATLCDTPLWKYICKVTRQLYPETSFIRVNDYYGFEHVHKLLDKAIEMAEQEGV